MDVRVELKRKLSAEELMLLNCGVEEDSWELDSWELDCKEIQPVNPKGNQSSTFIRKMVTEAPILWLPDKKNWLIGKDPDAGKDWRQEKGMPEDETVGRHHWCDGHDFEQAPGICDGEASLVCCNPWGRKELDTTEWLNWTDPSLPGFAGGSVVKNLPANAGDRGSIPGLGRSHGEGNGYALQYSCLGNPMDRGAWWARVHGVAKETDTT